MKYCRGVKIRGQEIKAVQEGCKYQRMGYLRGGRGGDDKSGAVCQGSRDQRAELATYGQKREAEENRWREQTGKEKSTISNAQSYIEEQNKETKSDQKDRQKKITVEIEGKEEVNRK